MAFKGDGFGLVILRTILIISATATTALKLYVGRSFNNV